jgi:hypothetical protein
MGIIDKLRSLADRTGGAWIAPLRESTWLELGSLVFTREYTRVEWSRESCFHTGVIGTEHEVTFCIFRSDNLDRMRTIYLACALNHGQRELRLLNERTELLSRKYSDEVIGNEKTVLVSPFNSSPDLLKALPAIRTAGQKRFWDHADCWIGKLNPR